MELLRIGIYILVYSLILTICIIGGLSRSAQCYDGGISCFGEGIRITIFGVIGGINFCLLMAFLYVRRIKHKTNQKNKRSLL